VEGKMSQLLTQDPVLKNLAQKAFVSYMRSIHLQRNKEVRAANSWVLPFAQDLRQFHLIGKYGPSLKRRFSRALYSEGKIMVVSISMQKYHDSCARTGNSAHAGTSLFLDDSCVPADL